jgi:hypothetical protein
MAGSENADVISDSSSRASSCRSQATPPSGVGSENPSTKGDSSESQASDSTQDTGNSGPLRKLVGEFTNADVAEQLFKAVRGKLEYAPQRKIVSFDDIQNTPLLDQIELDWAGIIVPLARTCVSSPSSTVPFSAGPNQSGGSSSSRQSGGSGNQSERASGTPNEGLNNRGNSTADNSRETATKPAIISLFRCLHNAYWPEVFCGSTSKRFRTCAGPGNNTIQHLK